MAEHNIVLNSELKDNVSASAKKIEASLGGASRASNTFGDAIKGAATKLLAIGAAYASVKAVTGLISSSVKAYTDQNEAVGLLTQSLGKYSQKLLDTASALQLTTKYGDETTVQAMAKLSLYVKEEDALNKLIPLVQDFATANSIDLASAASLVGKSIGSSTNALGRYIEISDMGNTTTSRLNAVTNKLAEAYGGSAAAASAAEGSITSTVNTLNDLKEIIGEVILPYLQMLSQKIMDNIGEIQKVVAFAAKSFVVIGKGVIVVGGTLLGVYTNFVGNIIKQIGRLVDIGNPMLLALMPKGLQEGIQKVSHGLQNVGEKMKDVSSISFDAVSSNFKTLFSSFDEGYTKSISLTEKLKTATITKKPKAAEAAEDTGAKEAAQKRLEEIRVLTAEHNRSMIELEKSFGLALIKEKESETAALALEKNSELQMLDLTLKEELERYKDNSQAILLIKEMDKNKRLEIDTKYSTEYGKIKAREVEEERKRIEENFNNNIAGTQQLVSLSKSFFNYRRNESKSWFNISKGLAIAETVINTYAGAVAAGKSAAQVPIVGWSLAPIIQAAHIANGLMQVNMIRKEKFAQGGIVGGNNFNGDNVSIRANSGEVMLNTRQMGNLIIAMANNKGSGVTNDNKNININVTGTNYDSRKFGRELAGVIDDVLTEARRSNKLTRYNAGA